MHIEDPPAVLELRCRNADGHLDVRRFTQGGPLDPAGSVLPARWLHDETGRWYVHKFVPTDAQFTAQLGLLSNEVRALSRLAQAFGRDHYPPSLPWMVGFNLSEVEPFVVLGNYGGERLSLRSKLDEPSLRAVTAGLFRALALTAAAGIEHGAVDVATLRWDGRLVRLVDFERSMVGGEPRNDVRAAGLVACRLAGLWIPVGDGEGRVKIPRELRRPLKKVLGPVERRPAANDVLARLKQPRVAETPPADSWLVEGARRFEEVCDTKRDYDRRRLQWVQVAVVVVVALTVVALLIWLVL